MTTASARYSDNKVGSLVVLAHKQHYIGVPVYYTCIRKKPTYPLAPITGQGYGTNTIVLIWCAVNWPICWSKVSPCQALSVSLVYLELQQTMHSFHCSLAEPLAALTVPFCSMQVSLNNRGYSYRQYHVGVRIIRHVYTPPLIQILIRIS